MTLAVQEKNKYEKVWTYGVYRENAPGEHLVNDAYDRLEMQPGQYLFDFGCGTGRAAQKFEEEGLEVIAIDHAANCLDRDKHGFTFLQYCLWDLPEDLCGEWGFCTDVMEHIPTEKVSKVLQNIKEICTKGVYFQIALRPDNMGPRILGEPLHLTVKDAGWWTEELFKHWRYVELDTNDGNLIAICRC